MLLSQFEDELRLMIEDNGIGFDVERWRNRRRAPGETPLEDATADAPSASTSV